MPSMKPKWVKWFDIVVLTVVVGLIAFYFAANEYMFRWAWKQLPADGECRIVCRIWNMDRHLFNQFQWTLDLSDVETKAPSVIHHSFKHIHGNRAWITYETREDKLKQRDYPSLLRDDLLEKLRWISAERPDGKPAARIEICLVTSDGTIHHPAAAVKAMEEAE